MHNYWCVFEILYIIGLYLDEKERFTSLLQDGRFDCPSYTLLVSSFVLNVTDSLSVVLPSKLVNLIMISSESEKSLTFVQW